MSALGGAVTKDDFTEDDGQAEGSFRMIVGGRHAVDFEEDEEAMVVAFGIEESEAESLGIGVRDRVGTKSVELAVELWDAGLGGEDGKGSGVTLTAQIAGMGEEGTKVIAESDRGGVVLGWR